MFGWKLISEREIALERQLHETRQASAEVALAGSKEYIAKLERLLEHERQRIDFERERADRLGDSLLQSSGIPPASSTVIAEQKQAEAAANDKRVDYMKTLDQIYGETMDDILAEDSEPIEETVSNG